MQFESEAQRVLDTAAKLGAEYADVRFGETRDEHIEVRNGVVSSLSDGESGGFSVRALVDGAWGFASSADMSDAELDRVGALAVSIAKASAKVKGHGISLVPSKAYVDSYKTPFEIDPATIALGERVGYLLAAEKEVRAAKGVTVARAWMDVWRTNKYFANREGSQIDQDLLQCGSAVHAFAVGPQRRARPLFPGHEWPLPNGRLRDR